MHRGGIPLHLSQEPDALSELFAHRAYPDDVLLALDPVSVRIHKPSEQGGPIALRQPEHPSRHGLAMGILPEVVGEPLAKHL